MLSLHVGPALNSEPQFCQGDKYSASFAAHLGVQTYPKEPKPIEIGPNRPTSDLRPCFSIIVVIEQHAVLSNHEQINGTFPS